MAVIDKSISNTKTEFTFLNNSSNTNINVINKDLVDTCIFRCAYHLRGMYIISVAGIVSAQLPFPIYGIGGIGNLGYAGGAGAFTQGFGPFLGFSPYNGIRHTLPLPVSVTETAGTTHTVAHTSAGAAPHHSASHVSKAVTVAHHIPTTHVTTVQHPVPAVTTHEQHVNYGPAFAGVEPYSPFFYGPGFSPFGPQYTTSFFKHHTIPTASHSTVVKCNYYPY